MIQNHGQIIGIKKVKSVVKLHNIIPFFTHQQKKPTRSKTAYGFLFQSEIKITFPPFSLCFILLNPAESFLYEKTVEKAPTTTFFVYKLLV
jgi:hypothetical protein